MLCTEGKEPHPLCEALTSAPHHNTGAGGGGDGMSRCTMWVPCCLTVHSPCRPSCPASHKYSLQREFCVLIFLGLEHIVILLNLWFSGKSAVIDGYRRGAYRMYEKCIQNTARSIGVHNYFFSVQTFGNAWKTQFSLKKVTPGILPWFEPNTSSETRVWFFISSHAQFLLQYKLSKCV